MKDLRRSFHRIFHRIFHHSSHLFSRRSSRRSSLLSSLLSSRRSSHRLSRQDARAVRRLPRDPVLAQNVQTQYHLLAVDVLATINSMHAYQADVHLVIALQYCYTVLDQHVYNSLGEL